MSVMQGFGKRYGWLLLVLLTAVSLHLTHITTAPPGLTHDEADHGITAWSIVDEGVRDIYFTIGYGREPLYDYLSAGMMALIGPTFLAGRLVSVFASLIGLAALYAWVKLAFSRRAALLTLAGAATGFWPLMTARQMLRSSLLPALFTLAVLFFWRGLRQIEIRDWRLEIAGQSSISNRQSPILKFFAAGIFLGLTFYVYLPARVLWALFPLLLMYWALVNRPLLRRVWKDAGVMLATGVLTAAPLFIYLFTHANIERRVKELSGPLTAVTHGNFQPLLQNTLASLQLFTFNGDSAWRYNLPGRPFLGPLLGVLFYVGVGLAVFTVFKRQGGKGVGEQGRKTISLAPLLPRSPALFALGWLLAGMSPVFVTGPELATTQAIGAQSVLYLFPALTLVWIGDWRLEIRDWRRNLQSPISVLLLFGATAVLTANAYFHTWANAPEVRVQYETTLITELRYLNEHPVNHAAISTITPAPEHSPAVAQMALHSPMDIRWFNGRSSLLLPANTQTTVFFPGFAPLGEGLTRYWGTAVPIATLPMRPDDADRPVQIFEIDTGAAQAAWQSQFIPPAAPTQISDALQFLGYDVQTPEARPGDPFVVATLWQVERPLPQAQLFTHLWSGAGEPAAQQDLLDAPGAGWQPGDLLIQRHELTAPAAGSYQLLVGAYDQVSGVRYPVFVDGRAQSDAILLQTITINP
ncbi:MAG: glycosyltransferase family 39 protein [Ardenticatenaceae bacterium]|nr:glycosyltransferase family 39 protein [Ardenticatenaceae bacterium]